MTIEATLATIAELLDACGVPFALVGGLAVSIRAEVRFTRNVDLAIRIEDDPAVERLVLDLRATFLPVSVVEQEERRRIAIARLRDRSGVVVDLLCASSGIEHEIVAAAVLVEVGAAARVPVARAEDLLAMKILSMRNARLQDTIDARNLVAIAAPDLAVVRERLHLIAARGYARGQDLQQKLDAFLAESSDE